MKILLSESQIQSIIKKLDEQETKTTEPKKDEDKGGDGTSALERMGKIMLNPVSALFDRLTPEGGKEVLSAMGINGATGGPAEFAPNIPPGQELMHPLGPKHKITSGFGYRNIGANTSKNHQGVDISASVGTPIYAPSDGKVISAKDTTPNHCGGFVKLDHPSLGLQTKYCHLSKWVVSQGQDVKKGQIIAYSGGQKGAQYAGNSQGPHLHYEVLNSGGIAMNPTKVHSDMA